MKHVMAGALIVLVIGLAIINHSLLKINRELIEANSRLAGADAGLNEANNMLRHSGSGISGTQIHELPDAGHAVVGYVYITDRAPERYSCRPGSGREIAVCMTVDGKNWTSLGGPMCRANEKIVGMTRDAGGHCIPREGI